MWSGSFRAILAEVLGMRHVPTDFIPRCLIYEGVSKSFQTGRLERQLQMVQLSAARRSCIAILWVSLVSFAAINLCVASQRVFIVVVDFVIDPRMIETKIACFSLLTCLNVQTAIQKLLKSTREPKKWEPSERKIHPNNVPVHSAQHVPKFWAKLST
jgi:hypothetical protein